MKTQTEPSVEEARIREIVDGWARAIRARNVDGLVAHHTSDLLLFDAIPPLRYAGTGEYRRLWEECFRCMPGPIDFEIREMQIAAGEDVAYCHSLNRMGGTMSSGERSAMWLRVTLCFRKIDGAWQVTHEHVSVPFDPNTLQAAVDLQP